jgi:hypothetical protein
MSVAVYGTGCGDDETEQPALDPTIADVVFAEGATDEALLALLAAAPKTDAAKAAALTAPADGAEVPGATAATFEWDVDATALREPAPFEKPSAGHARRFELLGGPRAAWAHGAPVNGNAYFVVFSTASNEKLVRVFTKGTSYTPDGAVWSKLKGAGAAITVTITWAYFEDNRVVQDGGGPWAGTPTTFTVTP